MPQVVAAVGSPSEVKKKTESTESRLNKMFSEEAEQKKQTEGQLARNGSVAPEGIAAAPEGESIAEAEGGPSIGQQLVPNRYITRILSLKVEIDFRNEESKKLYNFLKGMGWQYANYYNWQSRGTWAQIAGYRTVENPDDPTGVSKHIRKTKKEDLSGAAYSAVERELAGAWNRDGKKILAGQPLPERSPSAALIIRGNKNKDASGVRLEFENGQYMLHISVLNKDCPGGCWKVLPIARNTRRDEYQGDILRAMVAWEIPISKAAIIIKKHGVVAKLSFDRPFYLPPMGERVATLGPVSSEGRLLLRTELETKDYSHKLREILVKKDKWDFIRRRVMLQIGHRKGHARRKREVLARKPFSEWLKTYLHTWTRQIVVWCHSQGVGTIRVESINTGDWPADNFTKYLNDKGQEMNIQVQEGADINDPSAARAAAAVINKRQRTVKKRREAIRELTHQLGEGQQTEGRSSTSAEGSEASS